jgi:hypothetical protein
VLEGFLYASLEPGTFFVKFLSPIPNISVGRSRKGSVENAAASGARLPNRDKEIILKP